MRSAVANTLCQTIVRDNEQLDRWPRSPRSADVKNHYVFYDGGLRTRNDEKKETREIQEREIHGPCVRRTQRN